MLEAVHAAAPHDAIAIAWLAHAKAVTGDRDGALDRLAHWHSSTAPVPAPYHLAMAHTASASRRAFAALEQAMVEGDPALRCIAAEPRFEPLAMIRATRG